MTSTENNFDFSEVDTQSSNHNIKTGPKYIKLGTDKDKRPNVRVVSINNVNSNTTKTGEPFIKITAEDKDGYLTENDFFVNTQIKQGNKTSSFNVSRTDFVKLLVVTGMDEDAAKTYLSTATSEEDLASKIGAKTIGKKFKLGLYGKIAISSKGKFLKTMWSQGKNNILPVTSPDKDVFTSPNKDETAQYYAEIDRETIPPKTGAVNDLPF